MSKVCRVILRGAATSFLLFAQLAAASASEWIFETKTPDNYQCAMAVSNKAIPADTEIHIKVEKVGQNEVHLYQYDNTNNTVDGQPFGTRGYVWNPLGAWGVEDGTQNWTPNRHTEKITEGDVLKVKTVKAAKGVALFCCYREPNVDGFTSHPVTKVEQVPATDTADGFTRVTLDSGWVLDIRVVAPPF